MIYLKEFSTENEYLTYRNGSNYQKPNVSLCDDNDKVYYNLNANEHDYVDLGLPSGTLWATCNVGASKPSDYGLYFQWGDVQGYTFDQVGNGEGQKAFTWKDYKWNPSGDGKTFTKYNKTEGDVLELEDDAAHVNMGGSWHIPTPTQLQELIDNTTTAWTTLDDGVTGMTFTSKNGNSIFIPAAGDAWDGSVYSRGDNGFVWSSMLSSGSVSGGRYLYFVSNYAYLRYGSRSNGLSVRGVLG